MKITVKSGDTVYQCKAPYEGAEYLVSVGLYCPDCDQSKDSEGAKFRMPSFHTGDDAYTGNAVCAGCGRVIGVCTVKVDTIFGIREDRAVLLGRCRVY